MAANLELDKHEVGRYGRQMILPEWGLKGQLAVRSSSVLVVGVGGLGCPAALYLAAAGVGCLGLLDYDTVELNNLHRQILHNEQKIGLPKVDSACDFLSKLNSRVQCTLHQVLLTRHNALDILKDYDIVLDATDNVATRYLLNDACVLLGKPLVSGSALRFEGQLTVYNHNGGPCYRCLFPSPPPPATVTNCSEGGVLGVVPGIIGSLQALEALKLAAGIDTSYSQKLLLFDALPGTFKTIKLRPRQSHCAVCGENPSITELQDYEFFCGSRADDKEKAVNLLGPEDRVSCQEYKSVLDSGVSHLLLDVREPTEYEICHLENSTNVPLKQLQQCSVEQMGGLWRDLCQKVVGGCGGNSSTETCSIQVFVVCRRGNDSQQAVVDLRKHLGELSCDCKEAAAPSTSPSSLRLPALRIRDIAGGLERWADTVDPGFPKY